MILFAEGAAPNGSASPPDLWKGERAMKELTITTSTGGDLTITRESTLRFKAGSGFMYGILENTPATRLFLKRALARLERQADKRAHP
jgi:hypothetical protein